MLILKIVEIPVESQKQVKMTFLFLRIIHVNFKDCLWLNSLNLERITVYI